MVTLSTQHKSSFLDETLKKIVVIKNSLFDNSIKHDVVKNLFLPREFQKVAANKGRGVLIKQIDSSLDTRKMYAKMGPESELFPCIHTDADEYIHVIKGNLINKMAETEYKEAESYKIPRGEPHHLCSKEGCEVIISWDLK